MMRLGLRLAAAVAARAWVAALVGLCSCASFAAFKVPQTLPPGDQRILLGAALDLNSIEETGYLPLPDITLGSRFGLSERSDVGARMAFLPMGRRVTTMLLETSYRYQLVRDWRGSVNVAAEPSLGYRWLSAGGTDGHIGDLSLPLIAGLWVSDRHQIIMSPQASLQIGFSPGASPILVPAGGGSLGWLWQRIPSQALMLEASALWTPRGTEGTAGTALFHVGLGLLWTRR